MNDGRIALAVGILLAALNAVDLVAKSQGYEALGLSKPAGLWIGIAITFLGGLLAMLPKAGLSKRPARRKTDGAATTRPPSG